MFEKFAALVVHAAAASCSDKARPDNEFASTPCHCHRRTSHRMRASSCFSFAPLAVVAHPQRQRQRVMIGRSRAPVPHVPFDNHHGAWQNKIVLVTMREGICPRHDGTRRHLAPLVRSCHSTLNSPSMYRMGVSRYEMWTASHCHRADHPLWSVRRQAATLLARRDTNGTDVWPVKLESASRRQAYGWPSTSMQQSQQNELWMPRHRIPVLAGEVTNLPKEVVDRLKRRAPVYAHGENLIKRELGRVSGLEQHPAGITAALYDDLSSSEISARRRRISAFTSDPEVFWGLAVVLSPSSPLARRVNGKAGPLTRYPQIHGVV